MMFSVEVTPGVWQRLLAVRQGLECLCCGVWTEGEKAALELYGPLARRDTGSLTVGQIGQSLDGRIATSSGEVGEVSSLDGLEHLHRMRALVDGVVIGVRTALHDSPRLTVRLCEGANPARVVIDPRARLSNDSPVFLEDGTRRIVIQAVESERAAGVEVIRLPANNGQIDPAAIVQALNGAGLETLMVEGGSITLAKFIEAGVLDRLQIAVAPVLIGSGPSGLSLSNQSEKLSQSIRPATRPFLIGSEVVFDCGFTSSAEFALKPLHDK